MSEIETAFNRLYPGVEIRAIAEHSRTMPEAMNGADRMDCYLIDDPAGYVVRKTGSNEAEFIGIGNQ